MLFEFFFFVLSFAPKRSYHQLCRMSFGAQLYILRVEYMVFGTMERRTVEDRA